MIFLKNYSKSSAFTSLHEVPCMSPSEQEVWLPLASLPCWKKAYSLILTMLICIKCSLLSGSVLSTLQGLSPCTIILPKLLVVPVCNLYHELSILIGFVYWYWYSGNSPQFIAGIVSKVGLHIQDVIVLGLPQLEVGQVYLWSLRSY